MKVRTNEMNERERLVEILKDNQGDSTYYMTDEAVQSVSDVLLDNGIVVLPCKVGDTVYVIPKYNGKPYCGVQQDKVQMVGITSRGIHIKTRNKSSFNKTYMLGKTAFLTKEEAEKALKEGIAK